MRRHRQELETILPRFRGRRGVVQLRDLIPLATPLSESPGESWARIDIHDAGLPAPTPQYAIEVNGVVKYRLDLPYPEWKIVVEYDGEEHHTSPEDRAYDAMPARLAQTARMDRHRDHQGRLPPALTGDLARRAPGRSGRADAHDAPDAATQPPSALRRRS